MQELGLRLPCPAQNQSLLAGDLPDRLESGHSLVDRPGAEHDRDRVVEVSRLVKRPRSLAEVALSDGDRSRRQAQFRARRGALPLESCFLRIKKRDPGFRSLQPGLDRIELEQSVVRAALELGALRT